MTMTLTRTKSSTTEDRATAYAKAVVAGEFVAGPHVRNACRRHLDDLVQGEERGLVWDIDAADRVWRFFETQLKLSEGQFEGQPFLLHPSQAFKLGCLFGWKRADGTRRFRRAYIEEGKGNGKALALDTPIATPNGWTTMGDLVEGDIVFDDSGSPCRVIQAHPVSYDRDCYRVEFDDGEVIIASAEHLWQTEKRSATKLGEFRATKGVAKAEWGAWRNGLRTTAEIAETLRYANGKYQSANHSVSLAGPLSLPDADLPIEPYMLGVWLGDGDSDCARITIGDLDAAETVTAIRAEGWGVSEKQGTKRYRIDGLQVKLRAAGLLKNKHIPAEYMRASVSQRLSLLQGLMDTDGCISSSGQCEFTQVKRTLSEQVYELVVSLGFKATMRVGVAKLNGRAIGPKFRISFYPREDQPCFRLTRKLERQATRHSRRRLSGDRKIVSCERIPTVPVRCITVNSPNSMFLCGRSMVPTHNSPLAGGIGLYGLTSDGEAGSQVYAAAAKKEQAGILFQDACKMVRRSPALTKRLAFSGGLGREFNIAHHSSQSFFRPISKDAGKTGSGPRPHFALCDEVHEHPDRSIMEMLERGFKFRQNPLLLMITNSGSDRHSVCWEEHEHAVRVAAGTRTPDDAFTYVGEVIDDTTFSFICGLDPGDDPLEDPSCWVKANPLLGVILKEDYLAGVVAQAKAMPGKRNGILRLHFCVWTDADQAWIGREALESVLDDFDPYEEHAGKEVTLGVDLSGSRDLTAVAHVVETGTVSVERDDGSVVELPTFDAWIEAWMPGDSIKERAAADAAPYDVWAEQGFLNAPSGPRIRLDHVAAYLQQVDAEYKVKALAYDRYAWGKLTEELDALGCSLPEIEHPQGGKRKAKPSDEAVAAAKAAGEPAPEGLWMPGSVNALEALILEGRIRLRRNPVLISACMSAAVEADPFDNRWFSKRKATQRIDALVSLAMAVGAAGQAPAKKEREYQIFFVGG